MKEKDCEKCGDGFRPGFDTPISADFCAVCADHCSACGEWDVLEKGLCFGCNETII